jgi:hypothetical protein
VARAGETERVIGSVIADVEQGKAWSKTMEDGTLAVIMERLQKLEERMAEKDLEIAALKTQVRSPCIWLFDA